MKKNVIKIATRTHKITQQNKRDDLNELNPINVMIPLRGYHNIERCMGDGG